MPLSTRRLGKTGFQTTAIGFGAWAIGGTWGEVSEADAKATLHATLECRYIFRRNFSLGEF